MICYQICTRKFKRRLILLHLLEIVSWASIPHSHIAFIHNLIFTKVAIKHFLQYNSFLYPIPFPPKKHLCFVLHIVNTRSCMSDIFNLDRKRAKKLKEIPNLCFIFSQKFVSRNFSWCLRKRFYPFLYQHPLPPSPTKQMLLQAWEVSEDAKGKYIWRFAFSEASAFSSA